MFNHRVRLTYQPWTLSTTIGQYIVMEGLAESFSAELYGPECVGPRVGSLTAEETARSRFILSQALDVRVLTRFVPTYSWMKPQSSGVPRNLVFLVALAFTIGYQVVQAYLRPTSQTTTEAAFVASGDIIEASGFFA